MIEVVPSAPDLSPDTMIGWGQATVL